MELWNGQNKEKLDYHSVPSEISRHIKLDPYLGLICSDTGPLPLKELQIFSTS